MNCGFAVASFLKVTPDEIVDVIGSEGSVHGANVVSCLMEFTKLPRPCEKVNAFAVP